MIAREIAMRVVVTGAYVEIRSDVCRMRSADREVARLCASAENTRRLLGWEARYAGPDGLCVELTEAVQWLTEPSNLALFRAGKYAV